VARRVVVARALLGALSRRQIVALTGWSVTIAGFALYLTSLGPFRDAFGSVGTGVVLLVWLTLFSGLYYVTPSLRLGSRLRRSPRRPAPIAERVELVVAPSVALRNATAQGQMMSALGTRAAALSERETDVMDWGFAFGVAWAIAREQDLGAPEELVSRRALHATQAVYEAYRGSPAPALARPAAPAPNGRGPDGAAHSSATHA
jgi:hypothetical protein